MGRPLFIREVRHRFLFPFKRSPVLTYYSFNNRTVKRKPVTEPLLFQDVRGTTDLELSVDLLAEEDLEDRDEVDSKAGSRADSREGSNKVDSKDLLRARGVTCTFKAYVRLFFSHLVRVVPGLTLSSSGSSFLSMSDGKILRISSVLLVPSFVLIPR